MGAALSRLFNGRESLFLPATRFPQFVRSVDTRAISDKLNNNDAIDNRNVSLRTTGGTAGKGKITCMFVGKTNAAERDALNYKNICF